MVISTGSVGIAMIAVVSVSGSLMHDLVVTYGVWTSVVVAWSTVIESSVTFSWDCVVSLATYLGWADATGGGLSASVETAECAGSFDAAVSELDTSDGTVHLSAEDLG